MKSILRLLYFSLFYCIYPIFYLFIFFNIIIKDTIILGEYDEEMFFINV